MVSRIGKQRLSRLLSPYSASLRKHKNNKNRTTNSKFMQLKPAELSLHFQTAADTRAAPHCYLPELFSD
jgi:hypothetical protein